MPRYDDVRVVIPCFNHGRFVGEAVQSALEQEGGRPRIVVVDDGSTEPETARALSSLPEEVRVIRQENAGQATARNAGIRATEEPFLLMLDADDRLPPDALGNLHRALAAAPGAGYAYGTMRYFGDWSKEVHFPAYDPYRLLYRPIVGWIGLVRRQAFDATGGYDPALTGYEDWDFTLGAIEHGWDPVKLDAVVLDYRKHESSSHEEHRGDFRAVVRQLRAKHAGLYARAGEFAKQTDLGPAGRLFYRTYWATRPLPARFERWLYGRILR